MIEVSKNKGIMYKPLRLQKVLFLINQDYKEIYGKDLFDDFVLYRYGYVVKSVYDKLKMNHGKDVSYLDDGYVKGETDLKIGESVKDIVVKSITKYGKISYYNLLDEYNKRLDKIKLGFNYLTPEEIKEYNRRL